MPTIAFASLLALTDPSGPTDLADAPRPMEVYGGAPVPNGQHEAVVAISVGTGLCTGTLISPRIVLTAAHCFESEPSPTAVEVIFGNDTRDAVAVLQAADYEVHPCAASGCAQDGFDIAYVRLQDPAPTPTEGFPRPIVDQREYDDLSSVGSNVRVVGFGKDLAGDTGRKRFVDVEINSFRAFGNEFEAGGAGRDSCEGDSGGPALALSDTLQWRIVGVLSRGYTCGSGGIYVVPFPSLCWLEDETGVDLVPPTCPGCGCLDRDPDRFDDGACAVPNKRHRTYGGAGWVLLGLFAFTVSRRFTAS